MKAYLMGEPLLLAPGARRRAWMDETPKAFAYHCLPLVVANEAGYSLRLPYPVASTWDGGQGLPAVTVEGAGALSNFGSGVVTFHVGCIFRTDPGVQLIVTGPPNEPKDGAYPLTGIVETSWAVATFTMNWKHTRPGRVEWEEGEVFCHVMPAVVFGYQDECVQEPMPDALREQYSAWSGKRSRWDGQRRDLDYVRGTSPGGSSAPVGEHHKHVR